MIFFLTEGESGKVYEIERIGMDIKTVKRLEALGVLKGSRISVLTRKRRGAMVIEVGKTKLAVGRRLAENILVREVEA